MLPSVDLSDFAAQKKGEGLKVLEVKDHILLGIIGNLKSFTLHWGDCFILAPSVIEYFPSNMASLS